MIEENVRQATWPLISTLDSRLHADVAEAVKRGVATLSRSKVLKTLGVERHDLELANSQLENVGHWLYRVTPYADSLMSISRSKHKSRIIAVLPALLEQGWGLLDWAPRKKYGVHIERYKNIIFLTQWRNAVTKLALCKAHICLVSPSYTPPETTSVVTQWTFEDLHAALQKGISTFYVCTALKNSAVGRTLLQLASSTDVVSLKPIGSEHAYTGSNTEWRKVLDEDHSGGWQEKLPDPVSEFVAGITIGSNEREGVQDVLCEPARKRQRNSKTDEENGEEPSERPAVAAEAPGVRCEG